MKIAGSAVLSAAVLCLIAAPAFAQTTITKTTETVVTGPVIIGSPASVTRRSFVSTTYPGALIEEVPMPGYAFDYGDPKMDYSANFTEEAFGPGQTDLSPLGGG